MSFFKPSTVNDEITDDDPMSMDKVVVSNNNKRTTRINLPGTLTLEQWLACLEYFEHQCAYCKKDDYTVLEHFIPISHGGGTTIDNCVPSCNRCNGIKMAWNPLSPYCPNLKMKDGIERVQAYFLSVKQPATQEG